ncbi:MAG: class I SAM-dependent methyltransferase [Gemmatimonadota bacterium]
MKSRFADKFCHDDDAAGYDSDVGDESNPIRDGYEALLNWVAAEANDVGAGTAVDLGAGTGNLTARLFGFDRIVAVDVSSEMMSVARDKLGPAADVEWIQCDILEFFDWTPGFDAPLDEVSAVVSSYAVHHLIPQEKTELFRRVAAALRRGGKAVFGDLMFRNENERDQILNRYRSSGREALAAEIGDEFFWLIDERVPDLESLGFEVQVKQFSELSWGLAAQKALTS